MPTILELRRLAGRLPVAEVSTALARELHCLESGALLKLPLPTKAGSIPLVFCLYSGWVLTLRPRLERNNSCLSLLGAGIRDAHTKPKLLTAQS